MIQLGASGRRTMGGRVAPVEKERDWLETSWRLGGHFGETGSRKEGDKWKQKAGAY